MKDDIDIVKQELMGKGGMLNRIALNEGVDLNAARNLRVALESLIEIYREKSEVPKVLAAAFVDLTPLFERSLDRYSEEEQEQIEDIRNDIVSMASELFGE